MEKLKIFYQMNMRDNLMISNYIYKKYKKDEKKIQKEIQKEIKKFLK